MDAKAYIKMQEERDLQTLSMGKDEVKVEERKQMPKSKPEDSSEEEASSEGEE